MEAMIRFYGGTSERVNVLSANVGPYVSPDGVSHDFLFGHAHVVGEDGTKRFVHFGIYNAVAIEYAQ